MSAPIGGGGGLGGSSGPNMPSNGEMGPRSLQQQMSETEARVAQQKAEAETLRKAQQAEQGKAMAARLETPPTDTIADLEGRLEGQGPLGNIPGATRAPTPRTDFLDQATGGFSSTAFAPKPAETGQSGLVDEQPTDTSDKTVIQATAGRKAPAHVSDESLTLQTDRQDPTDMGETNRVQGNDATSGSADTAPTAQEDQQEPSSPTADHPAQPALDNAARVNTADVQPSSPDAQPPNAPRTPDDSHETQAAVQPPTMPPVSPDAAKAAEAQKAQERATYMNELIKADPEMAKILEDANISYDPKTGIDVEAALKQIPTDAKDRSIAQDRAVRRLQEVQGLALLHQGQQERDALLASGTDLTKGEGLEKLEKAEEQIRAGRGAEVTKRTREGIVADKSLQRAIRTSSDPNIQRMLEEVGGRVEDIDAGEVIKYLEAKKYETLGEARTRDEDQKLHDKLKRLHYGILGDQAAEDIGKATTPEKRAEAERQFKEAATSEVSHIGKLKEWLGDRFSGLNRQNLQYIKREVKGLQGGIKQLEKQRKATKDPKARAQLEVSIKNLKAQRSKELWKLRRLGLAKFLLILFIINSLAFTVGPALLGPQIFKMAGKSQG